MVALDPEVGLDFTWFDIGAVPEYGNYEAETALRNDPLPFHRCAVCGLDAEGRKFLLLVVAQPKVSGGGQLMVVHGWVMWTTGYSAIEGFSLFRQGGDISVGSADGLDKDQPDAEQYQPILAVLGYWLGRANPVGYRAMPKANSITNKRRIANGKKPLIFDWHTITIEPPAEKGEHLGGTHASPRQHERRGHWRTCANGNRVWVRHCTVGDASRGTVFKDYKVSQ